MDDWIPPSLTNNQISPLHNDNWDEERSMTREFQSFPVSVSLQVWEKTNAINNGLFLKF